MDTYEKQGEYRGFLSLLYLPVSGNQQVRFVSQGHTQSLVWMLSWFFMLTFTVMPRSLYSKISFLSDNCLFRTVCIYQVCLFLICTVLYLSALYFLCHFTTRSVDNLRSLCYFLRQLLFLTIGNNFVSSATLAIHHLFQPICECVGQCTTWHSLLPQPSSCNFL